MSTDKSHHDEHASHHDHGSHASADTPPGPTADAHHAHPTAAAKMPAHGGHGGGTGHAAHVDHTGHELVFRNRFWICLVLTVPVLLYSPMIQMWFGFTMPQFPGSQWIGAGFAIVIFLVGGVPFLQMAVPEIRNRKPGMMLLISLAICVAFFYSLVMLFVDPTSGFFWEMALLIDVMLLGHWLEMRSVRQASGALDQLAKLLPDTAERIDARGDVAAVPVTELHDGDLLLVRPGASVPADGKVEQGESAVNEAMITGESKPVTKREGDSVIAGTINGDGSLRVRVTATGEQTALAGIMRLVNEAQQSKSATQVLADRAAGWLFYIALAVAALTAVVWTIADGFNWHVVERVVTVLVIACPHTLGLAVPLVVAISTSLAARNGILVRNRLALEEARLLSTVVFDKTGTLTTGEQGLAGMATAGGVSEDDALAMAAAAEGDSEHMVARALRQAAEGRKLALPPVSNFAAIKGRGIEAQVGGESIYVGGPRLLEMLDVAPGANLAGFADAAGAQRRERCLPCGKSAHHGGICRGRYGASGERAGGTRPARHGQAGRHADRRQRGGCTGRGRRTGHRPLLCPGAARAQGRQDRRVAAQTAQTVAMVGDGVNDAPALARADVGIAIGSGTDVAIESAGIILVRSNPLDVAKTIKLSFATYRKMVQNLWWAAGYNIVALPLAAGVLAPIGIELSPAVGAALMAISTLVVALNAQTLRRVDLADFERVAGAVAATSISVLSRSRTNQAPAVVK